MAETTIRDFHDNDVWRDDQGTIWVRLEELAAAAAAERDRADRAEAQVADAWDQGYNTSSDLWENGAWWSVPNPYRSEATA